MKMRAVILTLSTVVLAGCFEAEPDEKASAEQLFNYYCASCHQVSGKGKFLKGIPANRITQMNKAEVVDLILFGKQSMPDMPDFRKLGLAKAQKIADHLWSLKR